jgi:RimJ/RimL family protein N-acetyltransferase
VSVPTTPETVEAAGLLLRAWAPELDADVVVEAAGDEANRRWNPFHPDPVEAGRDAALAWCLARADWSTGDHASWAVARADEPDLAVGSVSLHQIDRDNASAQVGYWVGRAHRRKGVAHASVAVAAAFAFGRLDLERIVLFHGVDNVASCRTAERAGFSLEGIHRRSYRYGDGLLHDEHSHARLRGDSAPTG